MKTYKLIDFEIEDIGIIEDYVYDIEVEDNHNFFGDDILLHNSCVISCDELIKDYENKKGIKFNTNKERVDFIKKADEKLFQPAINKKMLEIVDYMNCIKPTLKMARETIVRRGIFLKKKHYAISIVDDDGHYLEEPEMIVKGIKIVRSDTPQLIRDELKLCVKMILDTNDDKKLKSFITEIKTNFMKSSIEDIAFPKGISDIEKFIDGDSWIKGTPINARASILYNNLLKKYKLNKYPIIKNGTKIKFVYLKLPNPIKQNVIGWVNGYELPKEFGLEKYCDYKTQWEKSFLSPITDITNAIKWDIVSTHNKLF